MAIGQPPLASALPAGKEMATWTQPWGNWFTAVWSQLVYLLNAPVKTITENSTAVLTDSVILINGNVTLTLPTAAKAKNKRITAKAINAGVGTRTVSGNGSNIDGAATWTTTVQYASVDFVSNGVQWWTI